MNRSLTALFAAAEALLVVAIGIAIPLAPLTVLWGAQYGFGGDWAVFWRVSADAWLIGHGVDVTVIPDADASAAVGLPLAETPFAITLAALGFGLLTLLLAVRAGRRIAEAEHLVVGSIASLAVFAAAAALIGVTAAHEAARPSLWQSAVLPAAVFAVGLALGALRERGRRLRLSPRLSEPVRAVIAASLRGGTAAAAMVLTASALVLTAAILLGYGRIIGLYQGLHTEVLGGIVVTLGQFAVLPNLVIWTASWLIGPGFAIGVGSAVSPLGTQLGPLPALPVLGALPAGDVPFGLLGLLVPVIAGFLAGALAGLRLREVLGGLGTVLTGLGIGLIGGVLLGLLSAASAGAAGPGRLAQVGPEPWVVGAVAALELGLAAMAGLATTLRREPD